MASPSDRSARTELFANAPMITFWETTRACDLACMHCRAEAQSRRDPRELSTAEAKALLDEARGMGCPLFVLTGGDPAKRPDLLELVQYGHTIGLRMALTPSATPLLTDALIASLKPAGLARLALSLDGLEASHDRFRGVEGAHARTVAALRLARSVGLTTQINTSVGRHNLAELSALYELVSELRPELWSVFFIVPTGRASREQMLDAETTEQVLEWLADKLKTAAFDIKTTAAPHFRRVLLSRKMAQDKVRGVAADGIERAPRGINDGQGIAFVSHVGEIFPSGFLPIRCGNVRVEGLARTYRQSPIFRGLRDPEKLQGKCGACPFKRVCGGSRARAFAMSGNPFAADVACSYVPVGYRAPVSLPTV